MLLKGRFFNGFLGLYHTDECVGVLPQKNTFHPQGKFINVNMSSQAESTDAIFNFVMLFNQAPDVDANLKMLTDGCLHNKKPVLLWDESRKNKKGFPKNRKISDFAGGKPINTRGEPPIGKGFITGTGEIIS